METIKWLNYNCGLVFLLKCLLHFSQFINFWSCIFSADIRDFLQLDNPRNASINLEEDEEEDTVGAVVRYLILLNILKDYRDLCINQINWLKGFFLKGF